MDVFEARLLRIIRCERPLFDEVLAEKMPALTLFKEGWPWAKSFPQGLADDLPEERLQQGLQSARALLYGKSAMHADVDAWLSDPSNGVPLEEATEAVIARDVKIAATSKGYAEGEGSQSEAATGTTGS